MKLSVLLFAAPLVLLLSLIGPALSGQNPWYGTYPSPADVYADPSFDGAPYAPYDDEPSGFGDREPAYVPRDAPFWDHDPYRTDPYRAPVPEPYVRQFSDPGYPSYPPPFEESPYPPHRVRRPGSAAVWGDGYRERSVMPGELPPAARQGYRFRGDAPGFGGWGAASWQDGYRFRPLTEQERQQRDDMTGWLPRGLERGGERPRRPGSFPADEAYGYQSDTWFRRYYGERP